MPAPLSRKLLRDLWRRRGQVLSIALVVASGVAVVVTFRSTFDSLEASRDRYYRESRFADVFASLKRAPEPVAQRIAQLPGVAAVETRVVVPVTLDVPGLADPATGRLVSLPDAGEARLNRVALRSGRLPDAARGAEAVVNEQFALANGLRAGDHLGVVINGRWERLRIVGIALSPEYVYAAQPGAFLTDNRRFGVLWMRREGLAAAYGMRGAFNDVSLRLAPGASERLVIAETDRILTPFGGLGAYPRADQLSERVIADEVRQNRATGTVVPALILAVAAFLLNVVLGRLVATERDQIAILKAFGYTDRDVGLHYLAWALAAVGLGALIGIGAGIWLGDGLIGLYAEHFRFPVLRYRASWPLVAGAVALSALAASLGALAAVRQAVRLPPAEAMRPDPPARFVRGLLERLIPRAFLTPSARIVLRNLTRHPGRTMASVLGVGLSVSLLVVVLLFFDAIRWSFELQFAVAQRQDLTVLFDGPRPSAVRHELAALSGVSRVELFRSVPVRVRNGHRWRSVALTSAEPGAQLSRVLDGAGRPHETAGDGLLLTRTLAEVLGLPPGSTATVEVLEGRRRTMPVRVEGTVDEMFGVSAYMEPRALARLLGEAPAASGAHLAVDPPALDRVTRRLKRSPRVAAVTSPALMLRNFEEHIARNLNVNLLIISGFAGVIAIGVVYNGARIGLSERGRELASLRVLGFTRHEVAVILLGEQAVITLLGLPVGWGFGLLYADLWARSLSGEVYRIAIEPSAPSFLLASAVVLVMAAGAAAAVRLRLAHLDLIAVLKTRE